ncbi:unnamed protein product, partial [Brenthis ino]
MTFLEEEQHKCSRNEQSVVKRVLCMEVDGDNRRGQPKKRWVDCIEDDDTFGSVCSDPTCCASGRGFESRWGPSFV